MIYIINFNSFQLIQDHSQIASAFYSIHEQSIFTNLQHAFDNTIRPPKTVTASSLLELTATYLGLVDPMSHRILFIENCVRTIHAHAQSKNIQIAIKSHLHLLECTVREIGGYSSESTGNTMTGNILRDVFICSGFEVSHCGWGAFEVILFFFSKKVSRLQDGDSVLFSIVEENNFVCPRWLSTPPQPPETSTPSLSHHQQQQSSCNYNSGNTYQNTLLRKIHSLTLQIRIAAYCTFLQFSNITPTGSPAASSVGVKSVLSLPNSNNDLTGSFPHKPQDKESYQHSSVFEGKFHVTLHPSTILRKITEKNLSFPSLIQPFKSKFIISLIFSGLYYSLLDINLEKDKKIINKNIIQTFLNSPSGSQWISGVDSFEKLKQSAGLLTTATMKTKFYEMTGKTDFSFEVDDADDDDDDEETVQDEVDNEWDKNENVFIGTNRGNSNLGESIRGVTGRKLEKTPCPCLFQKGEELSHSHRSNRACFFNDNNPLRNQDWAKGIKSIHDFLHPFDNILLPLFERNYERPYPSRLSHVYQVEG